MGDFSTLQRISKIFGLVTSSTFFISIFVIIALTIITVIINHKVNSKVPKILIGIGYLVIVVFVILRYGTAIYNVQDSFTDKVFSSLYFPNLITYICILLISLFVIIIDFLDKNKTLVFKIISIISFGTIMALFVITLDVIKKSDIEVYSASSIYSNDNLMILIQATTSIFAIWILIELIDYFSRKFTSDQKSPNKQNINSKGNNINLKNKGINDYNNYRKENYLNNYIHVNNYYDNYYGIDGNPNSMQVPNYLNTSFSVMNNSNPKQEIKSNNSFNNRFDNKENSSYNLYSNSEDSYKSVNYLNDSLNKNETEFDDYFSK